VIHAIAVIVDAKLVEPLPAGEHKPVAIVTAIARAASIPVGVRNAGGVNAGGV